VDTRSLIALGMILAVVLVAVVRGVMDGDALEKVIALLGGGVLGGGVGYALRGRVDASKNGKHPTPPHGTPTVKP
jgi:hypothetical protein